MSAYEHEYISCLRSRHLEFLLASHMIKNSYVEFLEVENMGTTVGILQLYCIQAEI